MNLKRFNSLNGFLYSITTFLRLTVPPFLFLYPLPTVFIAIFLDSMDGEFASRYLITQEEYEIVDKGLDLWEYAIALAFSYSYFKQFFILLFILFLYRTIGYIVFLLTKRREVFVVFPNFFAHFFLVMFLASFVRPLSFLAGDNLVIYLVIVGFLTVLFEYQVHYKRFSFTKAIFGYDKNWLKH